MWIYDHFCIFINITQVECNRLTAVAMKQTLGRQVGEVREHECNMHVCVSRSGISKLRGYGNYGVSVIVR